MSLFTDRATLAAPTVWAAVVACGSLPFRGRPLATVQASGRPPAPAEVASSTP
jgi:hypothetical protein